MSALDDLLAARAGGAAASLAPAASGGGSDLDALLAARASGAAAPPAQTVTPHEMGWGTRFMQGLNDVSAAGGQMLVHALPSGVVDAVNHATAKVNDLPVIGPLTQMFGMVPATPQSIDADIAHNEQQYQANRQAAANNITGLVTGQQPKPGVDWARIGGTALGTAPLAVVGGPGAGVAKIALQGGLQGAAQPVTEVHGDDFWSQKGQQAAVGAATGVATNKALSGIAAVLAPKVRPEVQTLLDAGVTPTPGQIMGGGANRIEQAATSVPVLGDVIKNAQRRAVQQLNTAAINRSLEPIGESLPKGMAGREALDHAVTKLGDAYDAVTAKIGAVPHDSQLMGDLSNLSGMVSHLPKEQADQFNRIVSSEILDRFKGPAGVITGQDLKAAESNLGQLAKGYGKSTDFDQVQMAGAIREAQAMLRSFLARQAPEEASRLADINAGYANLLRAQRAASSVAADGGVFTPAQLQNAVKALDPSKNKRQFATGQAIMQDLSEAGKSVLGPTVPDSGTPLRHAVQMGLAGAVGHGALPESAAGLMVPAAAGLGALTLPYTVLGQKTAAALLAGERPQQVQQFARLVRALAAPAAAIAPAAVGVPNQ